MNRCAVLGIEFDNVTLGQAVKRAAELLEADKKSLVVTPNPEIVYLARKDASLRRILETADLVLPDGVGIVWGAKLLGRPLREKVAGVDFAKALLPVLAEKGKRLFLLGAAPGVAEKAAENLQKKVPGLIIAGTMDGYFADSRDAVRAVNGAEADVVFVCLGAPKQERFIHQHKEVMCARLYAGLGGSLDVFSGAVRRAPDIWIKLGLEWLYRLFQEPRRIGRIVKLPLFLLLVIQERIKEK